MPKDSSALKGSFNIKFDSSLYSWSAPKGDIEIPDAFPLGYDRPVTNVPLLISEHMLTNHSLQKETTEQLSDMVKELLEEAGYFTIAEMFLIDSSIAKDPKQLVDIAGKYISISILPKD